MDPARSGSSGDATVSGSSSSPANPGGTTSNHNTDLVPPVRPYDPPAPNSSATDATNSRTRSTDVTDTPAGAPTAAPWLAQFPALDINRDGQLSFTEFTTASVSGNGMGAANNGVAGGRASTNASTSVANGMTPDATTSTAAGGGVTGTAATTSSPNGRVVNSAQMFRMLDTNHDGYLSRAELQAYRSSTVPPR